MNHPTILPGAAKGPERELDLSLLHFESHKTRGKGYLVRGSSIHKTAKGHGGYRVSHMSGEISVHVHPSYAALQLHDPSIRNQVEVKYTSCIRHLCRRQSNTRPGRVGRGITKWKCRIEHVFRKRKKL